MRILYEALHNINLEKNIWERKEINEDFESYLKEYIDFSTQENDTKREYSIHDPNTTVIHCIGEILNKVVQHVSPDDLADSIAGKLLSVEKDVQAEINKLGVRVQRGSIIQALIEDESEYKYIIAKVEHLEYIEAQDFRRDVGFPSENKRVWKSAVIQMNLSEGVVSFGTVKCYASSGEPYWTHSFLEIEATRNDYFNTTEVYNAVNKVLSRSIKNNSPSDYFHLQNSFITTLQSEQQINYPELIERIVGPYQPIDESLDIFQIKEQLIDLQKTGKFDTQFKADPKAMKSKAKRKYSISDSIDLVVKEGIGDLQKSIKTIQTSSGEKYIQLLCENDDVFNLFSDK